MAGLFGLYALVHSLLASRQAKLLAARLSEDGRNGLYRFLFNVQAVVLLLMVGRVFVSLPDRTLYRVTAPWSWFMRLGQVAGLGLMLAAARVVGMTRISGLSPLGQLLRSGQAEPEPEAQGPPLSDEPGQLHVAGPFRFTRHPANWGPLPVVLLQPHVTVNWLVVAGLSVAYLLAGSVHEEARLLAAYGEPYRRYQEHVPFLVPVRAMGWGPTSHPGV